MNSVIVQDISDYEENFKLVVMYGEEAKKHADDPDRTEFERLTKLTVHHAVKCFNALSPA